MAAVRVPPSACTTSQSMVIWRSPSASRLTTARRLRPISRWISTVRPPCLPAEAPRRVRSKGARGPDLSLHAARSWSLASHDVPIGTSQVSLAQLNERSREIFRQIVESYLATGEPVGSRNISRLITTPLSPAPVRNVMSDLEQLGLVCAPPASGGRLPPELGLPFFVDALMEIGDLGEPDRREMEAKVAAAGKSMEAVLSQASAMLSGLTR